jgi:molybdopterin synthase catalytic subunit
MEKTATMHSSEEPGRGDFLELGYEPLDNERAVKLVTHASAGAISTFVGTTRDNFQGLSLPWLGLHWV